MKGAFKNKINELTQKTQIKDKQLTSKPKPKPKLNVNLNKQNFFSDEEKQETTVKKGNKAFSVSKQINNTQKVLNNTKSKSVNKTNTKANSILKKLEVIKDKPKFLQNNENFKTHGANSTTTNYQHSSFYENLNLCSENDTNKSKY